MVEVVKIMATSFQRPHTHTATLIIKKKWQEYTERYKKDLHDLDNHNGVITHLRARHPGLQSQMGLRKHHYEHS